MSTTLQFDFEPYAQILRTLLPRARGIYLYAATADLVWSADGSDSHDLRPAILQVLDAKSPGTATLLDDAPAYCFRLTDELGTTLGVVAVTCRPVARDAELPTLDAVERTLAPMLALARRELGREHALETGRFNVADTQELEWLLDMTHLEAPADAAGDTLQGLLEAFAARCDCDLTLLHLPGRCLERSVARCALTEAEIATLKGVVSHHLHRVAQLQQKTLIINKVRETGAGGLVPFRILCVPLIRRGQVLGVVVAFNRAASRPFEKREARMLERLAPRLQELIDVNFDSATGLLTRHAFETEAASLVARAKDAARCVVYADVDHLQSINDLYGFDAGDAALRAIGEVWRQQSVPGDSLTARVGSDGFVALLDGCAVARALVWAEATRLAIASIALPKPYDGLQITASVGVASLVGNGTLEHALAGAEAACNGAKELGRNRVESFAPLAGRIAEQQAELRLYQEFVAALDHDRLELYAQPLVPLWDPTRRPRYEVLVRLLDAAGQPMDAARFIPVAARHNLMVRLDQWVLATLLTRLGANAAVLARAGAVFAMNLSQQSLLQPELAGRIKNGLSAARVPPSLLSFDIAESIVASHLAETERFLAALAAAGCGASIDDFGTGATSLAYLTGLKVSALKIDGVFISDLLCNPRSESMVRGILHIARQLELETVAECVESAETAEQLTTLGVTYGQGRALGEPRPLAEVLDTLARKATPRLTEAVPRSVPDNQVH